MADNTAKARRELDGARSAVAEHIDKWRRYPHAHDKATALKTVRRVQRDIAQLKRRHPSLNQPSWQDDWTPPRP